MQWKIPKVVIGCLRSRNKNIEGHSKAKLKKNPKGMHMLSTPLPQRANV